MIREDSGKLIQYMVITLALVEAINLFTGRSLVSLGIFPRELSGLLGIVLSPFIHGSIWHFFANIIPLCVFTFLLYQLAANHFRQLTVFLILSTGLLVWLFARSSFHVGASGLIYGYFGYILVAGFMSKRIIPTLVAAVVAVVYGGMIFGVLPLRAYVSWESHLFGLLMGLAATKLFPLHTQDNLR